MNEMSSKDRDNIDRLVDEHGEQHRRLIEDAYQFFLERYPLWGVSKPFDVKINNDIKALVKEADKAGNK